jgi:DNA invertase Pin-like site-specific DNA recombinase
MKHIAVYLRMSSRSQDTASQERGLRRWARGLSEPVRSYRDSFTGKTMDRPGFNYLEHEIAAGNLSTLPVWRLYRLGRTAKELAALLEDLTKRKVNFVSLRDGVDLSTPAGRLMANVLASVAAYETEVRSERQVAGIAVAKARGVRFGRPPGSKSTRVPEAKRAAMIDHKAAGWRISDIARAVGLARKTVDAVLAAKLGGTPMPEYRIRWELDGIEADNPLEAAHNVTFSGNTAEEGGGIFDAGVLSVVNSSFVNNKAFADGGRSNTAAVPVLEGPSLAAARSPQTREAVSIAAVPSQ